MTDQKAQKPRGGVGAAPTAAGVTAKHDARSAEIIEFIRRPVDTRLLGAHERRAEEVAAVEAWMTRP